MHTIIWLEKLKGRNQLGVLIIDGRWKDLREIVREDVDWIHLAQDRD
jgi:hypothetical protein